MAYRNALIVVDFQRDFVDGSLPVPGALDAVPVVNGLISLFMDKGYPVIYTQDNHPAEIPHFDKWPVHCVENTEGQLLYPGIIKPDNYDPQGFVLKGMGQDDGYSGFSMPAECSLWLPDSARSFENLEDMLISMGVEDLTICGLAFDYCVKQTAIDAYQLGYNVFIPRSATAGVDKAECDAQVVMLSNLGIVVEEGGYVYSPPLDKQ